MKRNKRYSEETNRKHKRETNHAENEVEEKQTDKEETNHDKRDVYDECTKETGNCVENFWCSFIWLVWSGQGHVLHSVFVW